MTGPEAQPLSAKKAESTRPYLGQRILEDADLGRDLFARAARLLSDAHRLNSQGIYFEPFLEIGAGNTPRSLALANHYGVSGVASDLSLDSLRNAPLVQTLLGYAQIPWRICCDAHHLPFLADTFAFVFAYRTLHHFGDPRPVTAEIQRVLGCGGHFYFNEEPLTSPLRAWLRSGRVLCEPPTRMQSLAYHLGLHKVFWDDGGPERQVGIKEARYDRRLWQQALEPFSVLKVIVNSRLHLVSDLQHPAWKAWLSGWLGGNIEGLCQATRGEPARGAPGERLMCLDCGFGPLAYPLQGSLICPQCHRAYPQVDGVLRMLPATLEKELASLDN